MAVALWHCSCAMLFHCCVCNGWFSISFWTALVQQASNVHWQVNFDANPDPALILCDMRYAALAAQHSVLRVIRTYGTIHFMLLKMFTSQAAHSVSCSACNSLWCSPPCDPMSAWRFFASGSVSRFALQNPNAS